MPLRVTHLEYQPAPDLRPYIDSFWVSDAPQSDYNACGFWPDPYVDVIVSCGAPLYLCDNFGAREALPRVFINGLHLKPHRMWASGHAQIVAVRLYAWGVAPLLTSQTSQSTAGCVGLDEAWQQAGSVVTAQVQKYGYESGVATLEAFVRDTFERPDASVSADTAPLQSAARLLYTTNGAARIADVARVSYLSASALEKRFKLMLGVSPKTFARLIRFWASCEDLASDPARPSVELAQMLGYTDQAHLYHEFKALGELTPREFVARVQANYTAWKPNEFLQYA